MDEIRDIRKSDSLARFLDNHIVRTTPFRHNSSGEKSYRRAERLVAALHLLTSHVPEDEPVRGSIRKTGIKLLSDILLLRDEMRVSNSSKIRVTQSRIRELISLVRMLTVSGLVSTQNAGIVVEAIDELGNFLNLSQRTPLSESILLSRDELLSGGLPVEKRASSTVKDKIALSRTLKDRDSSVLTDIQSIEDSKRDMASHISATDELGVRGQEVLAILRSSGEVGIRDVSSNLPEYSEKMIQRELASLIAAGRVKKTGLKRWSRYSLVV